MAPPGDRPNPPPEVFRVTVQGTFGDARWNNVFWIRNGNGVTPSQADLTAMINDVVDSYINRFKVKSSTAWIVTGAVGLYYGETGGALDAVSSHTGAGLVAGAALSANVAACISWKVQPHYRGGHPRTYLAGIPDTVTATPTRFNTTEIGVIAGNANSFLADVNLLTHGEFHDTHLGTVSFVLRNEWRTPPIFRDFVPGSAKIDARIDSQRRRLGRDI